MAQEENNWIKILPTKLKINKCIAAAQRYSVQECDATKVSQKADAGYQKNSYNYLAVKPVI